MPSSFNHLSFLFRLVLSWDLTTLSTNNFSFYWPHLLGTSEGVVELYETWKKGQKLSKESNLVKKIFFLLRLCCVIKCSRIAFIQLHKKKVSGTFLTLFQYASSHKSRIIFFPPVCMWGCSNLIFWHMHAEDKKREKLLWRENEIAHMTPFDMSSFTLFLFFFWLRLFSSNCVCPVAWEFFFAYFDNLFLN